MSKSTTPAAEVRASAAPSREEIAREIEPAAWQLWGFDLPERSWRREASLRTADAVLALLRSRQPAPAPHGVEARIAELEAERAADRAEISRLHGLLRKLQPGPNRAERRAALAQDKETGCDR